MPVPINPSDALPESVLRQLDEAGFDLSSPAARGMAVVAYEAARTLYQLKRPSAPKEGLRLGRNDPCHCGSKQKYKKCCMTKDQDTPPRQVSGSPAFDIQAVPRIDDYETVAEDLHTLRDLLADEPAMGRVWFTPARLEAFLDQARLDTGRKASPEETDALAFRYAAESGEAKHLLRLRDVIGSVAARAKNAGEVRALATGIVFTTVYQADRKADNPITAWLFRLSIERMLRPTGLVKDLMSRLGTQDDLLARFTSQDPALLRQIEELTAQLTPEQRAALEGLGDDLDRDLRNALRDGRIPPLLCVASMLPIYLAGLIRRKRNEKASIEESQKVVDALVAGWTEEDDRLVSTLIEEALAEGATDLDRAVLPLLKHLDLLAKSHHLQSVLPIMVAGAAKHGAMVCLDEADDALVATWQPEKNDQEFLLRYAEAFQSRGLPAIAARTRRLAETVKP